MSPEQACGEQVTSASDIFSLGVVLYRLATGRHPFVADEGRLRLQGLVQALLVRAPVAPHRINEAVPPALEELILPDAREGPSEPAGRGGGPPRDERSRDARL